jgi:sirohydrochlorin cobaltochelatase
MVRAVILFAHGSRDPLWRLPVEAVAARLRAQHPGVAVRCAYLELDAPDLPTAADELVALGAQAIHILPMFLGSGRHAREDLPRLAAKVQARYPGVSVQLRPAVGEDPRVLDLLAKIALE